MQLQLLGHYMVILSHNLGVDEKSDGKIMIMMDQSNVYVDRYSNLCPDYI